MKRSASTTGFVVATSLLFAAAAAAQPGTQLHKIAASDGAANDSFGNAVAISPTVAFVGVFRDDDNGSLSGSTVLFDLADGKELGKLLPSDGAAGDEFGFAVGISDTFAIVGAHWDDDNGTDSGSAYLFSYSTTAARELFKLLAFDGAADDRFGVAVDVSESTTIVGANLDDDNGSRSGSAYLFDNSTGQQIAKLLPIDGAAGDRFATSVAIRGSIAIVGAFKEDNANGVNAGAAYLFDVFTGQQLFKLIADDGAPFDEFGISVAISDTMAVVGAHKDDDNGTTSGSAYIFDLATGRQMFKLLPDDGAAQDSFGLSVTIDGPTTIVGSPNDSDQGSRSGSAYIFDTFTGKQEAKMLPSDGAGFDQFGFSVATNGVTSVIGAPFSTGIAAITGAGYLFGRDTDADGLLDDWETNGISYTDAAGATQRFMLPGANPLHKDLYVEVDAMTGFTLGNAAIALLETAFTNAPVTNPDNINGIKLHVLTDETDLPHVALWQTDGCWPLDFNAWRTNHYGTAAQRGNAELLAAKATAYRYCIVADDASPNLIGGCGHLPGDNFVLFVDGFNDLEKAAVFMHELGHNLSLGHGGGDDVNGKPNYPSIMNYALSYHQPWNATFWQLDYTRAQAGAFPQLNEQSLNEILGVGTASGTYRNYKMPFGVNELDAAGNTVRVVKYLTLDGSQTDMGNTAGTMFLDGNFDLSVAQDLNYAVDPPPGISLPSAPSFSQVLTPYDDWANVGLPLAAMLGAAAPAPRIPTGELTREARAWMNANFPTPPSRCYADCDKSTGAGTLDIFDFLCFQSSFVAAEPYACDCDTTTGPLVCDIFDFLCFQNAFVAGCP